MKDNDTEFKNLYSNHALHEVHRDWVPDYKNPYNLVLTFANDISEKYAREMYNQFIRKLSKKIYKNAAKDSRGKKRVPQRGYLEANESERLHIHTFLDIRYDWDKRFVMAVHMLWKHGIVVQVEKVPLNEVERVHKYNSKMKTKKCDTGYYSDAYLVVE